MAKKKRTVQAVESVPESESTISTPQEPPPSGGRDDAAVIPPDLLTRPRTVKGDTIQFFRWSEQEWYGMPAEWNGVVGVAFLPVAHYHAANAIGIAPQQALASNAFFMAQAHYDTETELCEPPSATEPAPVIETIGSEEVF